LDICARWVKGDKGINVQIRNKRFNKNGAAFAAPGNLGNLS